MSNNLYLCDSCILNTENFPFLQCPEEPMEPESHYKINDRIPLNSSDYDFLLNLRRKECEKYVAISKSD